jgi:hypothetical protein
MMIPTLDMDLSVPLFGDTLFTPVIVGATPQQRRFHPDAELGTVRGDERPAVSGRRHCAARSLPGPVVFWQPSYGVVNTTSTQ